MDKDTARRRRARKARSVIGRAKMHRVVVNRTSNHIYASLVSPPLEGVSDVVMATVSSLDAALAKKTKGMKKVEIAKEVGKVFGEKVSKLNVERIAFDRAGFKYHGRVKALADAAREAGLKF